MPKGNPSPVCRGRTDHILSDYKIRAIRQLRREGVSHRETAKTLQVSATSVLKYQEPKP